MQKDLIFSSAPVQKFSLISEVGLKLVFRSRSETQQNFSSTCNKLHNHKNVAEVLSASASLQIASACFGVTSALQC